MSWIRVFALIERKRGEKMKKDRREEGEIILTTNVSLFFEEVELLK